MNILHFFLIYRRFVKLWSVIISNEIIKGDEKSFANNIIYFDFSNNYFYGCNITNNSIEM